MENNDMINIVLQEHRALKSVFSNIQREFDKPIVSTRVLHTQLSDALAEMTAHFSREDDGFFALLVARAPHLRSEAEELIAQHQAFRQQLERIVAELPRSSEETLFELSREFDQFLTRFYRHERCENQLVRQALGPRDLDD